MSIEGRINVDVLFHDKDGTTSLKVVSLQDSTAYTTAKVAIASGTCGTSATTLVPESGVGYRNAAGNIVTFESLSVIAVQGSDVIVEALGMVPPSETPAVFSSLYSNGKVATTKLPYVTDDLRVRSPNGTSSYTIVMYGT